ncbi:MAG: zf-HC2 domain-containing protein [Rhodothermales bacterium]
MSILAKIKRFVRGEPLSCQEVNRFLVDYLEGSMDERTQARFEKHLENCGCCEQFFEQYRNTVAVVRADEEIDIPDEVVERTMDFLKRHY